MLEEEEGGETLRPRYTSKKLTDQEEAMAKCEDEMYDADMLIESAYSALGRAEKVMSGEMRMEDLGSKFYICIQKLLRRSKNTVNQNTLPRILTRLKQKIEELIDERDSKKAGWKKVFDENSATQSDSNA